MARGTTHESVAAVSRALTPKVVPEVTSPNGALAVSADVSASGAARRDLAHLYLAAWLFDPQDGTRIVDLGRLRPGSSTYQGVPQTSCPCRLVGIGVLPSAKRVPSSGQIHLGLDALSLPLRHRARRRAPVLSSRKRPGARPWPASVSSRPVQGWVSTFR